MARVEVRGRWNLLEPGVALVDTPGVASLHGHNTEAARAALADADGAVLVLAADAPVSAHERELLGLLAERRAPSFFVLNKADHLAPAELEQVPRFVSDAISDVLGHSPALFVLSARAALAAATAGRQLDAAAGEFGAFVAELARFVAEDLVAARLATARRELGRLGAGLRDALVLEQGALALEASALAAQVERFGAEAARQGQAFEDDCSLLRRDVARLREEVARRFAAFAAGASGGTDQHLAQLAADLPRVDLTEGLRVAVESAVRQAFEAFRQSEADRTGRAWLGLAEGFRARTQERVNAVRQAAAELFAVPLPEIDLPAVAEEREVFSYLFIHVGTSTEGMGRALGRLVPDGVARRRALAHACKELARQLDKHAGRARADLAQRLDAVCLRVERAMAKQLDEAVAGILAAAARAEELRAAAETDRASHALEVARQAALADALAGLEEERG